MIQRIFTPQETRRRRKGSVIVETAFVALGFCLLLFAIFDFGQFLFVHQALVQRARNSIRTGSIKSETNDAIKYRILYNQNTAKLNANGTPAAGYFGLTSSNVTVTQLQAGTDSARYNVTISQFPFIMVSPLIAGNKTGTTINLVVPVGMYN